MNPLALEDEDDEDVKSLQLLLAQSKNFYNEEEANKDDFDQYEEDEYAEEEEDYHYLPTTIP